MKNELDGISKDRVKEIVQRMQQRTESSLRFGNQTAVNAVSEFQMENEKAAGKFPLRPISATFNLENWWLITTQNDVRKRAEAAYRTEKANDSALKWLNDAEKLIQEINNAIVKEAGPTSMWHGEMIKKIRKLKVECKLDRFFSPIPDLDYFSSETLVCFKSTEKASNELLEALKADGINVIGLYGNRGSGKTELVKAVGEKAKYLKFFDQVVFATVSRNPLKKVQDQIAHSLNVKFDKDSEFGRARKLYSTLSESMDKILVILDDVREKLDPEDLGIPCQTNQCKLKVLLTTRRKHEFTVDCQTVILLGPLSQMEALRLLMDYSGVNDADSSKEYLYLASDFIGACKMFPGIIRDIGPSLKDKLAGEWRATVFSMKNPKARYQIFISFRGEDTRDSFTGFLYEALRREGFKTFFDDKALKGGEELSETLIEAIEDSVLSIVIFSENYADSHWCLDELVYIVKCMKRKKQRVWPIFYKVSPSDFRDKIYDKVMAIHDKIVEKGSDQEMQTEKAKAKHEKDVRNSFDKTQEWIPALSEVAKLKSKMHYSTGYEYEFIEKIVERLNNIKNLLYIQSMDMD